MPTAHALRTASTRELRDAIVHGYPVDPFELEGWVYRGTSLGLPSFVERFTWKTFQKTFYRDPSSGRLMGWNVRLEQDGIDAPSRPKMRDGRPVTEWNYEVIPPDGVPMPAGFDRGLIIDYGRAPNPLGPMQIIKDPLVALEDGSADQLLGVSYLVVGGRCIETPTYFTLEREAEITYVPDELLVPEAYRGRFDGLRLSKVERDWAEALFTAILPASEAGLPAFNAPLEGEQAEFWNQFETAAAPLVRAGLRPMIYTLTFLPLISGFGKPFFLLSVEERSRFLDIAANDERYFVRQALTTLKMLACFAYFESPAARDHFKSQSAAGGAL
jgi:hypothetical protein